MTLIYLAICSLDGYVEDESGSFDWAAPDEEVHAFANDLARSVDTHLYGRRMYEVMRYWEDPPAGSDPVELAYAELWQAADKVVYSTTLAEVTTRRTRLERVFDPAALPDGVASVSGPTLAAHALRAGVVDEVQLLLNPVVVGGGKHALPAGLRLDLALREERRFGNGTVYLRYAVR